jgi:pimeloyl-ACP methyl ester carboxylesterase
MQSYAQDVCDKAEQIGKPCVLVGHSMGGAVISVAAQTRPELFGRMIYLTAFAPRMREKNLMSLRAAAPGKAMDKAVRLSLLKGSAKIDSQAAATVFYNTCTPEVAAQAVRWLCPEPVRPSFSSLGWTANRLGMIPKYYVECTEDRAIPIEGQRVLQQHMDFAGVATLPSDHSPFLSMPQRLAEVIVRFSSAAVR